MQCIMHDVWGLGKKNTRALVYDGIGLGVLGVVDSKEKES